MPGKPLLHGNDSVYGDKNALIFGCIYAENAQNIHILIALIRSYLLAKDHFINDFRRSPDKPDTWAFFIKLRR